MTSEDKGGAEGEEGEEGEDGESNLWRSLRLEALLKVRQVSAFLRENQNVTLRAVKAATCLLFLCFLRS